MIGTIEGLAFAAGCFLGAHFILSGLPVRHRLVAILGEAGFRIAYSLIAMVSLLWMIAAYRAAPAIPVWETGMTLIHVPVVLMVFASILAVAGVTTRTVTMVGGEGMADDPEAVSGIATITRHPFLWAVALWAIGHIAANGDRASIVFFGAFAVLSLGGMAHIDRRRRATMGAAWGPVAMSSSAIPFLAALQGRHPIDWRGIGWSRLAGGLVLYFALPLLHPWIAGVGILPDFLFDLIR